MCFSPTPARANSSNSAMRPPCYHLLEEIAILGVIYGTTLCPLQDGAMHRDLRCVFHPSTHGCLVQYTNGCRIRSAAGIHTVGTHSCIIRVLFLDQMPGWEPFVRQLRGGGARRGVDQCVRHATCRPSCVHLYSVFCNHVSF